MEAVILTIIRPITTSALQNTNRLMATAAAVNNGSLKKEAKSGSLKTTLTISNLPVATLITIPTNINPNLTIMLSHLGQKIWILQLGNRIIMVIKDRRASPTLLAFVP